MAFSFLRRSDSHAPHPFIALAAANQSTRNCCNIVISLIDHVCRNVPSKAERVLTDAREGFHPDHKRCPIRLKSYPADSTGLR
jgi:hypothetical protein